MEEEKKKPEPRRGAPGTGEQYLIALIKCADWVPRPYKQLAEKNRANPEVLKELYLCACDGVPVEKALEAQEKNPPEGALRFLRRKHISSTEMSDYEEDLSGIKEKTSTLEREVRKMSETLTHIVNHVPDFDEMFPKLSGMPPEQEETQDKGLVHDQKEELGKMPMQEQKRDVPKSGTQEAEAKQPRGNILEFGLQRMRQLKRENGIKKKSISDFLEKCMDEGYSYEQMEYLLDCIEEGMSLDEIKKIASPKLPVEMMQRLRKLTRRKGEK